MAIVNAKYKQNLLDIAAVELGNTEGVFDLAILNEISITDELQVGQQIIILDNVLDEELVNELKKKQAKPATADEFNNPIAHLEGIGYWGIGVDFTVS
ncbi:MAG: LysM domain-containing protein [Bacteroidetes bacterium]|nr:LysM domain-containing protein [Bacteroidota bacterium]